jgi:hypothetical protein
MVIVFNNRLPKFLVIKKPNTINLLFKIFANTSIDNLLAADYVGVVIVWSTINITNFF